MLLLFGCLRGQLAKIEEQFVGGGDKSSDRMAIPWHPLVVVLCRVSLSSLVEEFSARK